MCSLLFSSFPPIPFLHVREEEPSPHQTESKKRSSSSTSHLRSIRRRCPSFQRASPSSCGRILPRSSPTRASPTTCPTRRYVSLPFSLLHSPLPVRADDLLCNQLQLLSYRPARTGLLHREHSFFSCLPHFHSLTLPPHPQLFQHYPVLDPLYTQYEKNFHANTYVTFAQDTWPVLPLALCGLYALMIILGTKVMASRPKHEWKTALACWNLLLSVFSFCGMLRTVPHLLHNVATLPFKVGTSLLPSLHHSLC